MLCAKTAIKVALGPGSRERIKRFSSTLTRELESLLAVGWICLMVNLSFFVSLGVIERGEGR